MDEVAAAAAAVPEEDLLPTTERERQQALGRLIAIAEVSPRAAILEAWLEVERQLARLSTTRPKGAELEEPAGVTVAGLAAIRGRETAAKPELSEVGDHLARRPLAGLDRAVQVALEVD
jgi:hypothetical protein